MVAVGTPELSQITYDLFRALIYRETGIRMSDSKKVLVSNRLRRRLRALQLSTYEEYYRLLTGEAAGMRRELSSFIDAVSTNETYFYRGESHFQALGDAVLPELFQKRSSLKVWSAGCSTGEEPYTIGMVIREAAGSRWQGKVDIVATDINTDVIQRARHGEYSGRTLQFLPETFRDRYLEPLGADIYRVAETVRSSVHFSVHNLLSDDPPGAGFDIIFCRNVMIYFDRPTQTRLVDQKFARALRKDGYLFIGHSESLIGKSDRFRYARLMKSPIYQLRDATPGETND